MPPVRLLPCSWGKHFGRESGSEGIHVVDTLMDEAEAAVSAKFILGGSTYRSRSSEGPAGD